MTADKVKKDNTEVESIIKIFDMVEHEDGSVTVNMDITVEAARLLLEKGFIKLLTDHIKETECE